MHVWIDIHMYMYYVYVNIYMNTVIMNQKIQQN